MKSIPNGAGNVKMKGKKTCLMRCGCCQAVNFKDEVEEDFKDMEVECYELYQSDDPNDLYPQEPWAW